MARPDNTLDLTMTLMSCCGQLNSGVDFKGELVGCRRSCCVRTGMGVVDLMGQTPPAPHLPALLCRQRQACGQQ